MRVDDAIAHILRREGVAVAPCFPGNPLIEACARVDIRPIVARTEHVAVNIGGLALPTPRCRRRPTGSNARTPDAA